MTASSLSNIVCLCNILTYYYYYYYYSNLKGGRTSSIQRRLQTEQGRAACRLKRLKERLGCQIQSQAVAISGEEKLQQKFFTANWKKNCY
jgi:hypothetical protein